MTTQPPSVRQRLDWNSLRDSRSVRLASSAAYILTRPIDPRGKLFWALLLLLGLAFRFYAVLVFRNPMNAIFSDPSRHWDNAKHFLKPGAMGASNPYFYQLYLYLVFKATHDDKLAVGIVTSVLSASYPLVWYVFARSVFRTRINALRFATILCWIPSHISVFTYFLNETLILPLVGLALWLTKRTFDKRTAVSFVLAATTWTVALLTRSVVGPIGFACVVVAWLRLRRGRWIGLAVASLIAAIALGTASVRAHKVIGRYTPFGDNVLAAIYFVSGAHDYSIDFKTLGWYIFASPSLYVSPFKPFAEFQSIRKGNVAITIDPTRHGRDVEATLREQRRANRAKFPRLVYENLVFLSFGHSWPMAGSSGDQADRVCLWERWIWLPLTLVSLVGSIAYLFRRRKVAFVPLLTLGFIVNFFVIAPQVGFLEGRYRLPLEPVVLMAPLWLWDARRRPWPATRRRSAASFLASRGDDPTASLRPGRSVVETMMLQERAARGWALEAGGTSSSRGREC